MGAAPTSPASLHQGVKVEVKKIENYVIRVSAPIVWWLEVITYNNLDCVVSLFPLKNTTYFSSDVECPSRIKSVTVSKVGRDVHDVGWALIDAIENYNDLNAKHNETDLDVYADAKLRVVPLGAKLTGAIEFPDKATYELFIQDAGDEHLICNDEWHTLYQRLKYEI